MIHDRDAHADVLRVLDEEGAPDTVVFHCFSGDAAMARTCVDAGYVLSFAGPVTFKNAAELREAAALVPDGQLLVETDAPFLTPHPHRGRANEPYCLPWTVRGLATVRGVPAERVADSARRTAEAVFAAAVGRRRALAGRRGRRARRESPPFGDHGVSRFASDCHGPLPFVIAKPGWERSPAERERWSGAPRPHGFGHRDRAPAPDPTRSGCHVVDVFPRTRRTAAPARAAVELLPDDLLRDDLPIVPAISRDLDEWLTRAIPAVPATDDLPTAALRGGPGPRTAR